MRQKTCKACRGRFTPDRPMQVACSPACAIALQHQKRSRKIAKEATQSRQDALKRLRAMRTMSQLKKIAQSAFNAYIRERDDGLPCISCGRMHTGQWHAGHFLTTAAHPELRFEPRNVHRQCAPCNNHLSGNLINYRKGLIERYGQPLVDWLEGPHEPKHYSREDMEVEAAKWRKMLRMLKAAKKS